LKDDPERVYLLRPPLPLGEKGVTCLPQAEVRGELRRLYLLTLSTKRR